MNMVNQIRIPFSAQFKEPLLSGMKTQTARNKRYGHPGDVFFAFDQLFQLTKVYKCPLNLVAEDYIAEGCSSREEFVLVWEKLHPRKGFDPLREVWVHVFKKMEV